VTLLAFAAERRAAVDRYLLPAGPGAQQQTRRRLLQRSVDGTDGRTPYRYTDPAAYYASSVNNVILRCAIYSKKDRPYSITERRVPELIPVLGSQPAGNVSHKPGGRLPLLSARPSATPQPLRGLLPVLLLGEQRHNRCEQFA